MNTVVVKVARSDMLIRASQKLLKTSHGVIGVAILEDDQIGTGNGSLSAVLTGSLYQLGIFADKPVLPAIVVQNSLLEAKGTFPAFAEDVAHSMANLLYEKLTTKENSEPIVQVAAKRAEVVTESVTDVKALMDSFRETLKVSCTHHMK